MRCFQYCPGLIDEKPMIPFKTQTANWPTDANETWWQNGDNDDNVDDVDDKEEKEEENDDDDDDADVDSGVGASSDDDDDVVDDDDDDDDEDDDNVHDSDDGGDFCKVLMFMLTMTMIMTVDGLSWRHIFSEYFLLFIKNIILKNMITSTCVLVLQYSHKHIFK